MKLIDLSVIIEHNSKSESFPAKIKFHDHETSAKMYGNMGGLMVQRHFLMENH